MEQNLHCPENPEVYDFRQHDRVWQRISPSLEPYPTAFAKTGGPAVASSAPAGVPAAAPMAAEVPPAPAAPISAGMAKASGPQLPGAEENPCCMGSAAAGMLEVLAGFIEDELADRRQYLILARQSPSWARQTLRDIASDELGHAKKLMAVYYLITGTCYCGDPICEHIPMEPWCTALRRRYHAEACGGLNYIRASEGTTDPCLARLLAELSDDEYRHARTIMTMLERTIRC